MAKEQAPFPQQWRAVEETRQMYLTYGELLFHASRKVRLAGCLAVKLDANAEMRMELVHQVCLDTLWAKKNDPESASDLMVRLVVFEGQWRDQRVFLRCVCAFLFGFWASAGSSGVVEPIKKDSVFSCVRALPLSQVMCAWGRGGGSRKKLYFYSFFRYFIHDFINMLICIYGGFLCGELKIVFWCTLVRLFGFFFAAERSIL